jgi:cytochrome c
MLKGWNGFFFSILCVVLVVALGRTLTLKSVDEKIEASQASLSSSLQGKIDESTKVSETISPVAEKVEMLSQEIERLSSELEKAKINQKTNQSSVVTGAAASGFSLAGYNSFDQGLYNALSGQGINWLAGYIEPDQQQVFVEPAQSTTTSTQVASATKTPPVESKPESAVDLVAGKKVAKKCKSCHTFDKDGKHKSGPNLWNIVDSDIASKEGYTKYSTALKELEGVWSVENLDKFLTKPKKFVKKTKMTFSGLKKEKDRVNLIAYLSTLAD